MDDIKRIAKIILEQRNLIKIIQIFWNDIITSIRLEKCARVTLTRDKLFSTEDTKIDMNTEIRELDNKRL